MSSTPFGQYVREEGDQLRREWQGEADQWIAMDQERNCALEALAEALSNDADFLMKNWIKVTKDEKSVRILHREFGIQCWFTPTSLKGQPGSYRFVSGWIIGDGPEIAGALPREGLDSLASTLRAIARDVAEKLDAIATRKQDKAVRQQVTGSEA